MRIGKYTGLRVRRPNLNVREKEIENVLKREQRRHAVVMHIDEGNSIRKVPEYQPLDDEFARDFSEFDTLDEWRLAIRGELEERRRVSSEEKLCRKLLSLIIEDSDIPADEDLVTDVFSFIWDEFLGNLDAHCMSLETYIKRSGMSEEKIRASKEDEALFSVRTEIVLRGIADLEHLSVSPREVADEVNAMAEDEGMEPAELAEDMDDEDFEAVADQILMDKAMDFVIDHAEFED